MAGRPRKGRRVGGEERSEAEELLSLYCRVVDAKAYGRLDEIFTDDASIQVFVQNRSFKGPDEFRGFLDQTKPFSTDRMHFTSNLSLASGRSLRGLAYWHSVMTFKGTPVMEGGWYDLKFRREGGRLKISAMGIYHKYRTSMGSPSWERVGYPGTAVLESPDTRIFDSLRDWFYGSP